MKEKLIQHIDFTPSALREITLKVDAVDGINMGQGVCLLPTPGPVLKAALDAVNRGDNRYSPAQGVETLRRALAEKLRTYNSIPCSEDHIMITAGSSGAFETVCSAFLEPGDEIILFSPFYPYHRNVPMRKGAVVKYVPMRPPDWSFSAEELERAFSRKTKLVMVCTPGNPTGKVFTSGELETIAGCCRKYNAYCVTDEVYEYMTYDGNRHISMASLPGMFERTITMGSYSKTFSITGWRVGYLCAPRDVIKELTCINDQVYVCSPTPFQHAVAFGIEHLGKEYYTQMLADYARKRDLMEEALNGAGLSPVIPQGAYYMLADTSGKFPGLASEEVLEIMIRRVGVGAVPAGQFVDVEHQGDDGKSNFLRFCYSVPDETLKEAGRRLRDL